MKNLKKPASELRQGPRPEVVTLHFLGTRSPKPLWVEETIGTNSGRYAAIKALGYPATQMALDESGTKPPLFYIYLRTDEELYNIYKILGRWPSIYTSRVAIIKYMEKNSVNSLP